MWSESTFLSAKSARRSNTSVYSNFVFRRCVIYKRLASIEAKFISTSTRSKELDHRTKRKIDCRYTIGITCWVSCLPTLTNVWSVKVSYREILDVSRETSSPLVSPSMLLLEWIPRCERITRVCIYTGVVRFELRRSTSSSNCATIRNRRHNCIAISWKRGPLTNWSVHVFRSVRVF